MKRLLMWGFLCIAPTLIHAQGWSLVWSDEFEGEVLDDSKWSFQTGTGTEYGLTNWGNNELQYYQEENAVLDTGYLFITAKKENVGGKSYTSARIRTIDKGDWTYGRFEFRARMPVGKGMWGAIWMLPTDNAYGGWAASGELDIVEYLGDGPATVYGTLHFGGAWPNNQSKGDSYDLSSGDFHAAFHDFALEWEEGAIRWYVDGELYQTQDQGDWYTTGYPFPAPFDRRFHLLINLAVGGNWPGNPDGSTIFPQQLVLDYVRIYAWDPDATGIGREVSGGDYRLEQNHPNPFYPDTRITFALPKMEHVSLVVYDATGKVVRTLADSAFRPGSHGIDFNGSGLPAGLYSYRITAGAYRESRHMLLLSE